MGNIISNIKAQSQKIYKSTKGLILEEGIIQKSLDSSIGKVGLKSQKEYDGAIKTMKAIRDIGGVEQAAKNKNIGLKKTPKKMSVLGNSLSEEQLSNVGNAVSNRLSGQSSGAVIPNIDKAYDKLLKKTKGAIGMNMPGSVLGNYYLNPFKDGISAMGKTKFKDNRNLHKGMARVGGTVGGAILGGYAASKAIDDSKDSYSGPNNKYPRVNT